MSDVLSNSRILAAYRERTKGSAALAAEARSTFPSGITHDSRYLEPYGVYVARAAGPRKWDVDGNEYVDYFGGHGALMLGHNPPEVWPAVHAALDEGTHFGSNHTREIRWAQLVQELIPSAEQVRFTASGTEATHMALRLARAFTGRGKIARFRTSFHGWHDHMTSGFSSHFDGTATAGVLPQVAEQVVLLPPGDLAAAEAALAAEEDIAAVILEPTGSLFGKVPVSPEFVAGVRELTTRHGVLLIFDEVVTGFRVSSGGFQRHAGITPDLTTVAKILAGGLPGRCGGRPQGDPRRPRFRGGAARRARGKFSTRARSTPIWFPPLRASRRWRSSPRPMPVRERTTTVRNCATSSMRS